MVAGARRRTSTAAAWAFRAQASSPLACAIGREGDAGPRSDQGLVWLHVLRRRRDGGVKGHCPCALPLLQLLLSLPLLSFPT